MAEKGTTEDVRESKENLFNFLKSQFPSLFGSKIYDDVEFMGADPNDDTWILVRFKRTI